MSIDRAKLEEACQYAHQEIFGERRHPGKVACMDANLLNVLKMAGEAHLANLPKTKMVWHVSDANGSVHYDTVSETMEAAKDSLRFPVSDVTIGRREVPA